MNINVTVVNQKLNIATELKRFVSGTNQFICFNFKLPSDWDHLTCVAQFMQEGMVNSQGETVNAINVVLDSQHKAYMPPEVGPGKCTMMLYGSDGNVKATTNFIEFTIDESRQVVGSESHDWTPGIYEQICDYIDETFGQFVDMDDEEIRELISNQITDVITDYINSDEFVQRTIAIDDNSITNSKIADGTISRSKVNSAFEATLAKADTALQSIEDGSISREMVDTEFEATLAKADTAMQSIPDASIARSKVNAAFEATLAKADASSATVVVGQLPSSGYAGTDYILADNGLYMYYKYINNAWQLISGGTAEIITQDYNIDYFEHGDPEDNDYVADESYVGKYYLDIATLTPYTVVSETGTVDEEEVTTYSWEAGEPYVESPSEFSDYYIQFNGGDILHFRYVSDEFIQVGSSSSTQIVTELPQSGFADVDYILVTNGEYQYYKYLDNDWRLISGGGGEIITAPDTIVGNVIFLLGDDLPTSVPQDLDEDYTYLYVDTTNMDYYSINKTVTPVVWVRGGALVETPSQNKDYYITDRDGKYCHFRYNGSSFVQVGSTAYSKDEVDLMIGTLNGRITSLNTRIDGFDNRITTNQTNITSLNNVVTNLQQAVSEIDTEGYEYYADYGTYEIAGEEKDNVYRLRRVKGQESEVVSQFIIQGGGGGGQSMSTNLVVERVTPSPLIVTPNDTVTLSFRYSSVTNDEQHEEIDGTYTLKLGSTTIANGACVQGINSVDVTRHCIIGTQKFTLNVVDEGGSTAVRTFTVQKVDVRIESTFNDRYAMEAGKPVQFTYTPYGAISKTIHFELDGEEETITSSSSGVLQSYTIPAKTHGTHLLNVWATAVINGTEVETNHIYKDIIWYDPSMDEQGHYNRPLIGCIYRFDYYGQVTARQFDTTAIVYNVYDPSTNYPIINRYVDDVLIGTDNIQTGQAVWNYKSDTIGVHTLRIECGSTSVTIKINIVELGIDVSPITGGLELDFDPTGVTNNSENRIWSNDNYHMSVSENFDWANGGYKVDDNGDTYFLVKAGTNIEFDYEMFAGGIDGNPSVTGSEMKIVFMTENVQDANAVWFTNVETTSNTVDNVTSTTNMGIEMRVHEGWLKTNKASNSDVQVGEGSEQEEIAATNTYLYMPYSEEDIIEMDINIDTIDREDLSAQAFVMAYEDGVPSKAYVYDNSDRFYQYTPKPIKIGSSYCDVRIYRLKIYSASLTTEGIMRNFIADARNSTTMLERYDRNSIYYNNEDQEYTPYRGSGILDPERLAQVIPNVKVLMLETDHFTTSKKTFVKSSLRCIHAPGGTVYPGDEYYDNWYFENGWHSGQGTTSDNYGNSGRNVDFLFNCDGTHNPSDKIKDPEPDYISRVTLGYNTENAHTESVTDWKGDTGKVALTRTSIPNNFFNLKVNIASSENANNALMQKRYSDFLPYISPAKRRDSRIKNDMEFVPAVLFLKETNPDISAHNEFQDTEWHFYALGNLGDSKKTDYTRAYDPEDMNEFTIEISDNTKNNATFQTGVYKNQDGTYGYERFHLVKTLDKDGELVVTPVSETTIASHVYPVPQDQINELLFQEGTITVINNTGLSEHDGDEYGYLNMRIWCLYNEGFDGDHSFEPRYACCGDYRDGKLVNDYSGYGKKQVKTNEKVWRAFYKWVITSTNEQFVSELDQWCVRSAVEFFYGFTLYYTMMDNRAKNTFWHFAKTGVFREVTRPVEELLHIYCELIDDEYIPTEDTEIDPEKTYYTQYAFDQWGYDMDTGLGINNNGELIFPYGKEDTDYNIDGNASSGWVFNGATSAFWCRLRDLLSSEITETFNSVSAECFNATNLVNQFDRFQECFPEEVWRLDIERKYIRTYTGQSLDNSIPKHDMHYLRDMMQGRKKYQRRQWVRDQEIYYGTKYLMNNVVGDNNRITFRCYDPGTDVVVPPNYSLSITPFQDMYVSAMFGNGDQRQVRAKAGEPVSLNFAVDTATDTQVTIYGANRIAALNDLSACYVATIDFAMATKLRKLVLGNPTTGYVNSRLTALSIGTNRLLEELDIRNCINLTGTINLSQCSNLLKLFAEGTKITGVTFATNGKVQIAHLPSTINTLAMRNLNDLSDFQCTLDHLEQLRLQGGLLDTYQILSDTVDTLQEVYLYDIDWIVPNTNVLNALLNMYYSLVTGQVYVNGSIRLREIASYENKWSDLVVTYNPEYLVEQFVATYVNYDSTQLCQVYIDRGSIPPDPTLDNTIPIPTKPSDAQYNYTFSGWDNITSPMNSARTITAQYSSSIRTYTVNWYSRTGVLLETQQKQYGQEAVYTGDLPTRTDGESSLEYYVFTGWDTSTGYITGNTDVYATWDHAFLPTTPSSPSSPSARRLNDMTLAEIYGIGQSSHSATEYFEEGDYVDITVGNDFTFSNVESEVLCENQWFNGEESNCINTGIKLFNPDSPSFTLAIDYEFYSTDNGQAVIACYNSSQTTGDGFILRYTNNPVVEWAGQTQQIGTSSYRNICVIRHQTGSRKLLVYYYNTNGQTYEDTISFNEVTAQRDVTIDLPLIIGGSQYIAANGSIFYRNPYTGWIHWCKIWYQDLGDANARELAAWPHETWRANYYNGNRRYEDNWTGEFHKMAFILNNALGSLRSLGVSSSGGWPSFEIRNPFFSNKLYNAFPVGWRSIMKEVRVKSNDGTANQEIVTSGGTSGDVIIPGDKIFIPSISEVTNSYTYYPYSSEGFLIPFLDSSADCIKFMGQIVPENYHYFNSSTDPTLVTANNVQAGDIWYKPDSPAKAYIYIPPEVSSKHVYHSVDTWTSGAIVDASTGGIWYPSTGWFTRSPYYQGEYQYWDILAVSNVGNSSQANMYGSYALVPCFVV